MGIFEAKNFGDFLKIHMKNLPNKGRGLLRSIAIATDIHSTTLSQAVKGTRLFSLEQVASICQYLGLSETETKYALLLSQVERAGTETLRKIYTQELQSFKKQALDISSAVPKRKILAEEQKAIFYSNWYYTAITVLSSLPNLNEPFALSQRLGISKQKTNQAIRFLINSGICLEKNGKIETNANATTYLDADSPFLDRHLSNWRIQAMEKHPNIDETQLAFTSPMSLSKEDAKKIRTLIVDLIRQAHKICEPSACEEAYFLNIDWIKF